MPHQLRYAIRSLAKTPAFTIAAVFTLALGIGANAAMFSVLDATLLRPLPYPDQNRLVHVWGRFTGIGLPHDLNDISPPEFREIENRSHSFAAIAAIRNDAYNVTVGAAALHVSGAAVSPPFFDVLAVEPSLGRRFAPAEAQPGRDRVVVLSHGLWQRAFGGDRTVIGQIVRINSEPNTIVGVMPASFDYPTGAELWKPLAFAPADLEPNNRGNHGLEVIARIKPILTIDGARVDMGMLTASMVGDHPEYPYRTFDFAVLLTPIVEDIVGDVRPVLYLLMGAVGLVLLVACANVANLQLVRASARTRDRTVRAALGASGWQLVAELLVESVVVAVGGGVGGLMLAFGMIRSMQPLIAHVLPADRVAIDLSVLAFTALVSVATIILFGVAPAGHAHRVDAGDALKASARTIGTLGSRRLRAVIVASEVAVAVMILVGAGLLGRSLLRLLSVDPGFRPEGVLTFRLSLPENTYSTDEARIDFFRRALDRTRRVPGAQSVGAVNVLPLSGSSNSGTVTIDTVAVPLERTTPEADWRPVLPGFFETMGVRLIAGRFFTDADDAHAAPVAIVDETLARSYWPGESAIGKRVKTGGRQSTSPWRTIVGVVGHVRYRTLEAPSRTELYWPAFQRPWPGLTFVVRTPMDPSALRSLVEREISAIDPDEPVYAVRTMTEVMAGSVARRQLAVTLLTVFATITLLLAIVGVYGLTSYAVTERTRELGIRLALGAEPRAVVMSVLGASVRLTVIGLVLGLVGTLILTRTIESMLFKTPARDPVTLALVSVALFATALVASYAPARRVAQIDPAVTLRDE
jgi:putative ABC transport system permease protein